MEPLWKEIHDNPESTYFLVKSYQAEHIEVSQQHGVWATGSRNEKVFSQAFSSSPYVVLLFSVNGSGHFHGCALMRSKPGQGRVKEPIFKSPDGRSFPGRQFDVEWLSTRKMSFRQFEFVLNELNENKPVKVGRDGQPLSRTAGAKILQIIESSSGDDQSQSSSGRQIGRQNASKGESRQNRFHSSHSGQNRSGNAWQQRPPLLPSTPHNSSRRDGQQNFQHGGLMMVPFAQGMYRQDGGNQPYSQGVYRQDAAPSFPQGQYRQDAGGQPYVQTQFRQETQPPPPPPPAWQPPTIPLQDEENVVAPFKLKEISVLNPALSLFPVDLTSFSYENYFALCEESRRELYKGQERWAPRPEELAELWDWSRGLLEETGLADANSLARALAAIVE